VVPVVLSAVSIVPIVLSAVSVVPVVLSAVSVVPKTLYKCLKFLNLKEGMPATSPEQYCLKYASLSGEFSLQ
jgi:hypothetical protein